MKSPRPCPYLKAPRVSRKPCPSPRVQPRGAVSCSRCKRYREALLKARLWLEKDWAYHGATLKAVIAMLSPENPKLR